MLKTRVVTALVILPIVLADLIMGSSAAWGFFLAVVFALGMFELARLCGATKLASMSVALASLCVALAMLVWPYAIALTPVSSVTRAMVLAAAAACLLGYVLMLMREQIPVALRFVLGAIILCGAILAAYMARGEFGWLALLLVLAIVWVSDIAAYFAGRAFGRTKLAPRISPGKTWAGVWGALAAVAVYAALVFTLAQKAFDTTTLAGQPIVWWIGGAILLAVGGILGDLFESWLKRQAGVKDSGSLLPGHGGVLDRIDALLPVLPLAYLMLKVGR